MPRHRTKAEGLLRHTVAWVYCTLWVPLIILVCAPLPRRIKERVWPKMARSWGRTMLRIGGVGLRIDTASVRQLADRKPRVLLFNHSSTLDTFVGAAVLPEGGVLVLKREFLFLPLLGQATWAVGSIFVDRSNGDKARESLARAVTKVRERRLQVLIAPEGTRVKGPEMGRFKLGGFRLAQKAGAGIVPVVMHRCQELWPPGAFAPTAGTLHVTTLPEVFLGDATEDELRVIADQIRADYITEQARFAATSQGT